MPTQKPRPKGFTLIELLVVITIIVVLLALLTPALDKAIYQAELVVCGSHEKVIASTVQVYAAGNKRWYPYRPGAANSGTWNPHKLWNGVGAGSDDRAILRQYLSLNKVLNDPLCETVDFENALIGSHTYATYFLWFGFAFTGNAGMEKIGDRLTWTETNTGGDPRRYRFNVLASDNDDIRYSNGIVFNGHPDHDGLLTVRAVQDGGGVPVGVAGIGGASTNVIARWESQGAIYRGGEDMHYAHGDGSVQRVVDVRLHSPEDPEDRLTKVGAHTGDTETVNLYTQLPSN